MSNFVVREQSSHYVYHSAAEILKLNNYKQKSFDTDVFFCNLLQTLYQVVFCFLFLSIALLIFFNVRNILFRKIRKHKRSFISPRQASTMFPP